jgi:hypothetical protein
MDRELLEELAGLLTLLSPLYYVGMAIAVVMSWESSHTIGWATLHGLSSWLYVGYRFIAPR